MTSDISSQLRELSKDPSSSDKLEQLFDRVAGERDRALQQLELLERAIRNDYEGIMITGLELDPPGPEIVYVNDGFCKMTGYSREELIGETPRILQGPETDQEVLEELKQRLKEGQSFFGQTVNYRKDGSEFVNQWDIHPLTDNEGTITHWVSYQHDITDRKRSEQLLVDMNVEFDDLREASHSTVLDADTDGNIVMANRALRQLIGYGIDELKGRKVWELFPEKYSHRLRSRFESADRKEAFDDQEFRTVIHHESGFPIQIQGKTRVMELKDRTLIRVDIKNISLRKRVMDTLQRRNRAYSRILDRADSGSGEEE